MKTTKNIEHRFSGGILAVVIVSLLGFYFDDWGMIAIANGFLVGWLLRINYIKIEPTFIDDLFDLALVVIVMCGIYLGVYIGILPAILGDDPYSIIWLYVLCMISPVLIGFLRQRFKKGN